MKAQRTVRRRGQPLLALILLMVSWVGARAAMWETPKIVPAQPSPAQVVSQPQAKPDKPRRPAAPRIVPVERHLAPPITEPSVSQPIAPAIAPPENAVTAESSPQPVPQEDNAERLSPAVAAGHQDLYSMGMNMPTIDQGEAMDTPRSARLPSQAALVQAAGSHWSADAWLLVREGGNGFNAPGAGLPGAVVPVGFYGGSQLGAVLRYRLAPSSPMRPSIYLRGSSGLEYPRGEEVAVSFSIRPLVKVPVALMAEGRATHTPSGTKLRPAVALVTELPPARLPLGLRGEAYAQAGYVGGQDSTAFVDGQARIERPVARSGRFELRAGGGVWGGAQKGANRLDMGPTATLAVPIGPAGARLTADYRIRVAGQAAPGSGAVLTLSAGF